jgi:hypothetical protein
MAENVKRRVAAARLAVAFVAAGALAGAGAWASAGPVAPTARKAGGEQIETGKLKIDSANVENRSLLYKDFKAGQIPSFRMFDKLHDGFFKFKKAVNEYKPRFEGQLDTIRGELTTIKGELGSYVKLSDADSRYVKMNDAVMGDGSVFNAVKEAGGQDPVPIVGVPNLINIDALPAEQQIRITNTSGGNLTYSQCGGHVGGGTMAPGQSLSCATGDQADVLQLIGGLGASAVTTLNFSSVPAVQVGARNYIIAILVGM